jgi:putative N6-adenine-specific DNA methylase
VSKHPRRISNDAPGRKPPAPPPRSRAAKQPATATAQKAGIAPASQECFAIVAPGLEALALAEAARMGLPATLAEGGGGIQWQGDLGSALRANVGLRIASRVVVRLARFRATSFAELEREARKVAWRRVIPADSTVRFRVTCKKSRLYHSDAVAQRVADAIVRALPGTRAPDAARGAGSLDDLDDVAVEANEQLIIVRMFHDECTISADTSGELLHRRGYRQATAKAPMRETIAAALLAASGWDGVAPLVDPLCGSGTIPIEAALLARHLAAGASRQFAVERWPSFPRAVSTLVRAELAGDAAPRAPGVIVGSDRDAGAVTAALANAERAGVSADVELVERSISALVLPEGPPGWVVANPPYGIRVGDVERVRDLWARLGSVLRERGRGWRVALLSPDPALERQLGIPMRVVATTTNGGIPVRLIVGEVRA